MDSFLSALSEPGYRAVTRKGTQPLLGSMKTRAVTGRCPIRGKGLIGIAAFRVAMMAVLVAFLLSIGLSAAYAGTLDNNYPAGGYPADIVRTGVKSRAALAANYSIYSIFGMDRNFIYYSNDVDLWCGTTQRWAGQPGYNYGDAWADTIFGTGYWFTPVRNCIANADSQTFRAFEWGGTFVACACGNMSWGISNPPPPSISGTVWNDLNGNGVRDPGEPGLPGRTVFLMQGATQRLTTPTDSGGNFTFKVDANVGLLPGTYSLALQAPSPGWNLTRAPGSTTIAEGSANAGRNFSGNDFGLHLNTYTLTYTAGPGGTISGTSPQTVSHGADGSQVSATPDPGYHFVGWSDDPTISAARTETNVTADKSVTASFAINTYTLTYTAGPGGTISGTSPQTVSHGADGSQVSATPDPGYHFVGWSDDPTIGAARTETNVTADKSVTASFAINTYTLTYTAGPGGTISGTSPQTVNHGADGTEVTAIPEPGYHFVGWSDDPSVGASRTETNVTADMSVTASFAINTVQQGWMTGGGSVQCSDGTLVTHGFELHGDPANSPNTLEVNWGSENRFHLEMMDSAQCYNDPALDPMSPAAGFDTHHGTGTGRLNGVSGYSIEWTFTDEGEPGTKDSATIVIKDSSGAVVLSVSGKLLGGNQQAHGKAPIPKGADVTVVAGPATVTFPDVTTEGTLTVTQYSPRRTGPFEYRLVPNLYFDIHPSATFVGPATVVLSLPTDYAGDLSKLKVLHWEGTQWRTLPCTFDVEARTVTFRTDSFSDFALAEPSTLKRIWRFRSNHMVGSYLWTIDPDETLSIRANLSSVWTYEGPSFTTNEANPANVHTMVRFRNRQDASYFWTADPVEIANLRDNLSSTWALEGPAWKVSRTPTGVPVWRFRCLRNSTHLWTIDTNEKQTIVDKLQDTYELEGVAYYLGQ